MRPADLSSASPKPSRHEIVVGNASPLNPTRSDRSSAAFGSSMQKHSNENTAAAPSPMFSGTRLALAPEKKPARTSMLPAEPGPPGTRQCAQGALQQVGTTTVLSASLRRSHLRVVAVPAERRDSAWSVPQLCAGLCAVSIFLLSALFAATLAFHTVNRVNVVSNLLLQIVNETRKGGGNGTASAGTPLPLETVSTTEGLLSRHDLVDAVNKTERHDNDDQLVPRNGTDWSRWSSNVRTEFSV